MRVLIDKQGVLQFVYQEEVDLSSLGKHMICRASQVEPDADGTWYVAIIGGITKRGFTSRSSALRWEKDYVEAEILPRGGNSNG